MRFPRFFRAMAKENSMLALEIRLSSGEHLVIAAENVVYIKASYGESERPMDFVYAGGVDDSCSYRWLCKTPQKGDKLLVRVVDVDKEAVSAPQRIEKKDRKELEEECKHLETELKNKQLI